MSQGALKKSESDLLTVIGERQAHRVRLVRVRESQHVDWLIDDLRKDPEIVDLKWSDSPKRMSEQIYRRLRTLGIPIKSAELAVYLEMRQDMIRQGGE